MSEKKQHDDTAQSKDVAQSEGLATIDNLDITPLSDEELDSVAGGYTDVNTGAPSCTCCAAGSTVIAPRPTTGIG